MEKDEELRGGLHRGHVTRSGARATHIGVLPADARLIWAGRIVSGALATGMLLSPALWMSRPARAPIGESFPMVAPIPVLEIFALPAPLDFLLFAGVLALCALAVALPGRRLIFAALFCCCLLLAAPDMMRWQPWFFLYALAAGVLAFIPAKGISHSWPLSWVEPLRILRLSVGCVYFYSGMNKLNSAFFAEKLAGFLAGIPSFINDGAIAMAMTFSAPFVEVAAGAGLLAGVLLSSLRLRHVAAGLAAGTNLFVLVALVGAAANVVVLPWNAAMLALVVILFGGHDGEPKKPRSLVPVRHLGGYFYAAAVCVLFAVMPILGLLGHWPSYLSFALYSENTSEATVATGGGRASVTDMTYEHLNVPAYPSWAVYEAVGERSCAGRGAESGGLRGPALVVQGRPDILDGSRERREYTCASEAAPEADPTGPSAPLAEAR